MKDTIEIIEEYLEQPGSPTLAYVGKYERGLLKAIIDSIRKERARVGQLEEPGDLKSPTYGFESHLWHH